MAEKVVGNDAFLDHTASCLFDEVCVSCPIRASFNFVILYFIYNFSMKSHTLDPGLELSVRWVQFML